MVGALLFGYSSEKVLGGLILVGVLLAAGLSGIFSGGERQRPRNKWSNAEMTRTINQGLLVFVFTLPVFLGFFLNYLLIVK